MNAPTRAADETFVQSKAERPRVRVGVSACLLGQAVRYDGGHKHDRHVSDELGAWFELVPVCPEVEIGLGVPREPLRLVRDAGGIRMLGETSGSDHGDEMRDYSRRRVAELGALGICGYILKKGSPSCGMEQVPTFTPEGAPAAADRGLHAAALIEAMPLLPMEEEAGLAEPARREHFIERVLAYSRVQQMFTGRWTVVDLAEFHSRERALVSAHEPAARVILDSAVAVARHSPRSEVARHYRRVFLQALASPLRHPRDQ